MEQTTADPGIMEYPFAAIREELKKILGNKLFITSPILCRFLEFVVEHKLAGRENELKEYTVGIHVLGKPTAFNPRLDASVRIHANRLRKMILAYYETNLPLNGIRIELPTGHYRPVFKAVVAQYDAHPLITDGNIIEIITLDEKEDICIVPFTGYNPELFAGHPIDPPCAMLYKKLSLFQDISLVPMERIFDYFKNGGTLGSIRKRLGGQYYLCGNVGIENDVISITVSLFNAINNEFVVNLTCREEKNKGSLTQAMERVISRIAASLADYTGLFHIQNFALAAVVPMPGVVSHAIFWYHKFLTNNRIEVFSEALAQMKEAVKKYPGSHLSWAVLGHLLTDGVVYNYLPVRPSLDDALYAAGKSLEANPDSQHGHIAAGYVLLFYRETDRAIFHFKRAISINPYSAYFKTTASLGLAMAGDYQSSIFHLEAALKLNSIPGWWVYLPYVFISLKEGNYTKMLFYSRKVTTPSGVYEHIFEMIALFYLDKKDELVHILGEYTLSNPGGIAFVTNSIPMVLMDKELVDLILHALHGIRKLHSKNTQRLKPALVD
jgi:tetratricopeptide (TPR) repeat protein